MVTLAPDAALVGDERPAVLATGAEPPCDDPDAGEPRDDADAALTDDHEESLETDPADGATLAPQPKNDCELVSARKNHGLQPVASDSVPNWSRESNEG
jgi:hypothetical protein